MSTQNRWTRLLLMLCIGVMGVGIGESAAQRILIPPRFPLPNPEDFVEITAGNYHTCARKNNGNVFCWGLNTMGQVGNGGSFGQFEDRARFVMIASQIEAGTDHTCALNVGGAAWCWGNNLWGALGANNSMAAQQGWGSDHWPSPIAVDGGLTFTSISGGMYSTCGSTTTGLFCWGKLMTPQGGAGTPSPVRVTSFTGYGRVSAGYQHMCAMFAGGGTHCFGNGAQGQTGLDPNYFYLAGLPSQTMFGNAVSRVSTQVDYTCVDQASGIVQCVGDNTNGQLGNGTIAVPWTTPYPQTVGNGMALRAVTTGSTHACALNPAGAAFCWGSGANGMLGNGAPQTSASPQAVRGGFTFRAIAAGAFHTCGITTGNQIVCWGSNSWGQLGIGRTSSPFYEPSPFDLVKF